MCRIGKSVAALRRLHQTSLMFQVDFRGVEVCLVPSILTPKEWRSLVSIIVPLQHLFPCRLPLPYSILWGDNWMSTQEFRYWEHSWLSDNKTWPAEASRPPPFAPPALHLHVTILFLTDHPFVVGDSIPCDSPCISKVGLRTQLEGQLRASPAVPIQPFTTFSYFSIFNFRRLG